MAFASGTTFGVYEVGALVGVGGMGEVYRARDTRLGRDVAIKVLPAAFSTDPERIARFQREAMTLAAMNHPNIAAIHGLDEHQGITALVLELVEGPTLAERISHGPIPLDDALAIATQVVDALEAAHEKGIIHRDLKPANIKVRADGAVKVLDFGLAKAIAPATAPSSASLSPTITTPAMTQAGVILGSAAYMSPEQARGKPVDRRTDIWAFGCVLFEMLTGKRAFDAEDVSLTLAEVMKSDPDWRALPALPPAIEMCLRRCLKKDPRLRLRDIGEARLALDGTLDADLVKSSARVSQAGRRGWRFALPWGVAAVSTIAALLVWLWSGPPRTLPEVVRFQIHPPAGSKIQPGTPAISPDGRTLAYRMDGPNGASGIHLQDIHSTESRLLPGTENAVHPFWSPDGRSLAFVSNRVLKRIDRIGGTARELVSQVSGPWHGSWGQFGDVLFTLNGVSRVLDEGGRATPAVQLDATAGEIGSGHPVFLPDGRRFLVRINKETGGGIYLASIESPDRKLLLDHIDSAVLIAPTPRGATYLLYLRDDALVAHEFDVTAGEVVGTPRLLVDSIGRVANPPILPTVGVSPAGVLAYQVGGDFTQTGLSWLDRSGKLLGDVPGDVSPAIFALSPDARLVAFDSNPTAGERDVRITDLTRGVTSLMARGGRTPVWSPNGRQVAFLQSGRIYVKDVDGSSGETVLADINGIPRSWSSDGRFLLYETPDRKLLLWPLGGGSPIPIGAPNGSARDGRLSPDGRYIAYASDDGGRYEVVLERVPPATGRLQISAGGGVQPRWSASGRELFFIAPAREVSGSPTLMAVDVPLGDTLPAGAARKVFDIDTFFGNVGYDVAGNGERFLVVRQRQSDVPNAPITVVLNWWVEFARLN